MKKFLFLLSVILLSACASGPMLSEYNGKDKGYLVASITSSDLNADVTFMIVYRDTKINKKGSHFWYVQRNMWGDSERDFDNKNYNGIVEVHSLPPGNYELFTYKYLYGGGSSVSPQKQFSYPFTVKSGEITYIGEYKASGLWGDDCCNYFVKNELERDMVLAKNKANINGLKINVMVPKTSYLGE